MAVARLQTKSCLPGFRSNTGNLPENMRLETMINQFFQCLPSVFPWLFPWIFSQLRSVQGATWPRASPRRSAAPWESWEPWEPAKLWGTEIWSQWIWNIINGHFRNRLIGGTYHIFVGLFFRAMVQGIYPQNMAWNMVRTYLHDFGSWNFHWYWWDNYDGSMKYPLWGFGWCETFRTFTNLCIIPVDITGMIMG